MAVNTFFATFYLQSKVQANFLKLLIYAVLVFKITYSVSSGTIRWYLVRVFDYSFSQLSQKLVND